MSDATRSARAERRTSETKIDLRLTIDGSGASQIETSIGFFDHMLAAFSKHGLFDLEVKCDGDLEVDAHHSVEDVGIVLGQAIAEAVGDKAGIVRFGHSYVPMDDALARVVVDLSGRPCLAINRSFRGTLGDFPAPLVSEFFRAVSDHGRMNLHVDLLRGQDDHHSIEAIFKAFGRALDAATLRSERIQGVPSTKGSL
ncbi:MAG: imidazoleglycerol-phosphate dehydratase HisB [Candidatus Latescibacterota bacterium]|nr:imidazoleglycerol-phosphate dehydratase HisB [Candidatus Latescibacterota bacterium]